MVVVLPAPRKPPSMRKRMEDMGIRGTGDRGQETGDRGQTTRFQISPRCFWRSCGTSISRKESSDVGKRIRHFAVGFVFVGRHPGKLPLLGIGRIGIG